MSGDRRRPTFIRAALGGSALALLIDVLMLSAGHLGLWQPMGLLGSFYDAQGRALLHGHLSVPAASVSFEGFVIGGRTYMYFGPVPALLRLPILLATHALDGRLTQLSMSVALAVLLLCGARLHWRIRELIRPGADVGRGEQITVFALAVALGAGIPLFLVSWAVVYQEAELWGAAFSLAAIEAVCGVVARPTGRRIAWAGFLAVLAVNTRVSVGVGPILALGLLAVATGTGSLAAALGDERRAGRWSRSVAALGPTRPQSGARVTASLAIAAALALGSTVAINEAKFHSAFGLPLASQVNTRVDPNQRAYVRANHGALLGAKFVPTTLLAAVSPDALGSVRAFPFVGLPDSPPPVFGGARFNALLPSLSAFTSMPLFCLLLLAGVPAWVRRRSAMPLVGLLAATGAAFVPALAFGSTATRYLADLLPFLWVGACAGFQGLLASSRLHAATRRPSSRVAALAAAGLLMLASVVINGSVGLVQQRLLAPTTSAADRASFVQTQDDIDRFLGRPPHGVHHGAALPLRPAGPAGDLFVLGRCDGLYVQGFDGSWLPVERSDRSGLHELTVRFPPLSRAATPQALLTLGTGADRVTVVTREMAPGIVFSIRAGGRTIATGQPISLAVRAPRRLAVSIDPLDGAWFLSVELPGVRSGVLGAVPYNRLAPVTLGSDPGDHRLSPFGGQVSAVPEPTPVCDEVARRARIL